MKAYFIGTNGSMGLKYGWQYEVNFIDLPAYPNSYVLEWLDGVHFDWCVYPSYEKVLENWSFA